MIHKSDPTTRLGILASLKLSKKGMPRPDKKMCQDKAIETVLHLSRPPVEDPRKWWGLRPLSLSIDRPLLWSQVDDSEEREGLWYADRNELVRELERTVDELCADWSYTRDDRCRPLFPSFNASYHASRAQGGAAAYLQARWLSREFSGGLPDAHRGLELSARLTTSLRSRLYRQEVLVADPGSGSLQPVGSGSGSGDTGFWIDWQSAMPADHIQDPVASVDLDLHDLSGRFWNFCLKQAMTERPLVLPVGLSEALKVRVITKGPSFTYFVLKPLQRALRERLAHFQEFKSLAIGGDLRPLDFLQVLGGSLPEGYGFLSGDYEAATDNLRSWVSEVIWERLCKCLHLSAAERELGFRALTQHDLSLDDRSLKLIDPTLREQFATGVRQRTGQLMGSIISFPILCIANYAISRMVIERDATILNKGRRSRFPLGRLPCLINGDDVVFRCSPAGRAAWRIYASSVGLKESVGKTYYSREFLEMNSRLMEYVEHPELDPSLVFQDPITGKARHQHYRFTPLINMGLVNGLKRSAGKFGVEEVLGSLREAPIGARHRELMSECGDQWMEAVHRLFLIRNHDVLSRVHVPWYVSERFGGLGLFPLKGTGASETDVRLCRAIALNDLAVASSNPEAGPGWSEAVQRLRENFGYLSRQLHYRQREVSVAVATRLALALFLTSAETRLKIDEVLPLSRKTGQAAAIDALRENERLWRRLQAGRYGYPSCQWKIGTEVYRDLDDLRLIVGPASRIPAVGLPLLSVYS